ncbi:hypothetical protein EX30DRAFT_32344 [Ascodesmis nigricans]|uniref:Uncharacterized protein n=1 Tax=Ascodesmis nigricans TaxID=341454 RepID=A0A4S2MWI0_9PEZI|nr:hypothetical protein EX30DRAFT_32344 [Ascodesmis nigricans]
MMSTAASTFSVLVVTLDYRVPQASPPPSLHPSIHPSIHASNKVSASTSAQLILPVSPRPPPSPGLPTPPQAMFRSSPPSLSPGVHHPSISLHHPSWSRRITPSRSHHKPAPVSAAPEIPGRWCHGGGMAWHGMAWRGVE